MTKENLLQHLQECCDRMFGCSLEMATEKQVYRAVCVAVRELLEDDRRAFVEQTRAEQRKQVYYMSMEFLVGTSLRNNLYNMGLLEPAGEILHDLGFSLESLCALEPDAGLGNGGLGRLASCYGQTVSLRPPVAFTTGTDPIRMAISCDRPQGSDFDGIRYRSDAA